MVDDSQNSKISSKSFEINEFEVNDTFLLKIEDTLEIIEKSSDLQEIIDSVTYLNQICIKVDDEFEDWEKLLTDEYAMCKYAELLANWSDEKLGLNVLVFL